MKDKMENERRDFSIAEEVSLAAAPRSVRENRSISARLRSEQFPCRDHDLLPRPATVDLGTVPAAFEPEELAASVKPNDGARPADLDDQPKPAAPSNSVENRRVSARLYGQAAVKESVQTTGEQSAMKLTVRLAETPWDHLQAFHLVYRQYRSFGYDARRLNPLRIQPWNLTSRSHTLIAERNGQVVGTVTCLEDGADGFPAEKIYPAEIRRLRDQGRALIEMSSFAVESKDDTDADVVLHTLRAAVTYCRKELNATDWICTVNPRHERFYVKVMLFEKLGGEAASQAVNNAPTVLLRLNLETLPERYAQKYGKRSGARNLHAFFFEPTAEDRRVAQLRQAAEQRRWHWEVTREALTLLRE